MSRPRTKQRRSTSHVGRETMASGTVPSQKALKQQPQARAVERASIKFILRDRATAQFARY